MIQKGTYFKVVDNSGAKKACCIHVSGGYRKRYGKTGDVIVVSIKSLRAKRREVSKIKKGDVVKLAKELLKKEVLFKSDVEALIGKRPYEEKKSLDITIDPKDEVSEEPENEIPEELKNPPAI